jgi:hypothetical protein
MPLQIQSSFFLPCRKEYYLPIFMSINNFDPQRPR